MTKTPAVRTLFAGFLLFLGSITQAHAQGAKYSAEQMLDPRLAPKLDDVVISMPTPEELKSCTVVSVQGATASSGGFMLVDANKKPLRRFFDSKGGGKVDIWSYFKDGVEVYREFDTTYKGSPNNFRWLNAGGMKWGVGGVDPKTGRGFISTWRMISAEEVGYEAFQAVARQDYARLQALFISDTDMQAIKLPAAQVKRIAAAQQQAQAKFAGLVKTMNLAQAKFEVVEGGVPNCDNTGDAETIKFPSRAIRFELNKEHKWIHTGEMIQVGMAWRLVDVPSDKDMGGTNNVPMQVAGNPELEKLHKQRAEIDLKQPPTAGPLARNAEVHAYYKARIELVRQIAGLDKGDQLEGWYKQLFDNLTALAQNEGTPATVGLLKQMTDDVVTKMPGSNLAAYGVYREAWTRYAISMYQSKDDQKKITLCQDKWLDDLSEFVKKYNKAEDTPEALHQLAIGCEFGGKTEEAKRWYNQLVESFPSHHLAARSRGSVARLNLVGSPMSLTAPLLDGGQAFDLGQLKGKIVIVHYWRSANSEQYKDDFARLKGKLTEIGTKQNVALVSINLDDDAATARAAIATTQAPGVHLFQAPSNNSGGGLNSTLATQYGIHILPTLFMVNRDGRVTSNSLQIGDIETELRKVQ